MSSGRVLILGATGQVGYELARLPFGGREVIAYDRAQAPLDDFDRLRSIVSETRPDWVINAAAYTAVDLAEREPDLAMRLNTEAPHVLARACATTGARLMHYSTDYVFDGARWDRPYQEHDPVGPKNVYGHTKLGGEHAVLEHPRHLVLRVSWVYGLRGKNFFLTMQRLQAEGKPIRVVADQIGAPTWSREIALATERVVLTTAPHEPGGLYHLGSAGQASWYDFAQAIFTEMGVPVDLSPISTADFPTPAQRPKWSLLDSTRFQDRFGFSLPDWREQLKAVLAEQSSAAKLL